MPNLIIVSNRLPVKIKKTNKGLEYKQSSGGLATGLKSFYKSYNSIWIGWPGLPVNKISNDRSDVKKTLNNDYNCEPIFLTESEINNYYLGYSNKTIWPLCHYFTQYVTYDRQFWKSYKSVNKKFAQKVIDIANRGDIVWIHDYHLMLLPQMIRDKIKDVSIGYFHHIPFPSYEIFRLLPNRSKLLKGLMGADLIGYHTYDYMRHFQSSVQRLMGYENELGNFNYKKRIVKVDSFPMGIDFDKYSQASKEKSVIQEIEVLKQKMKDQTVILSIDRMDYTKGIIQRLKAYDLFLEKNPQYKEKIKFIVVTAPSREEVEQYNQLKLKVERFVGDINGKHGILGWMPIWYLHKTFDFKNLVALYNISDIYVVTPLRDGMNLMAKEYLAARNDKKGVLILSEMAGASKELGETIIVNPNNILSIVAALKKAINLPVKNKININKTMRSRLKRYNVSRWAEDFFTKLKEMKKFAKTLEANKLDTQLQQDIIKNYKNSNKRLLLLDYDGTILPYIKENESIEIPQEIKKILKKISHNKKNNLVILSDKSKELLDQWFNNIEVDLVSDQGAYIKKYDDEWQRFDRFDGSWKDKLLPILKLFVDRTPGSRIREKEFSLIWDFSNASFDQGVLRSRELVNELLGITSNLELQILEREKEVEIRVSGLSKEHAALRWLMNQDWDFVLAISDGFTSSRFFEYLPRKSYTIKVGIPEAKSKYYVDSHDEIVNFLKKL